MVFSIGDEFWFMTLLTNTQGIPGNISARPYKGSKPDTELQTLAWVHFMHYVSGMI